jgi:hypothetical protein
MRYCIPRVVASATILLFTSATLFAQEPPYAPARGLTATGEYMVSNIETIDAVSGNVFYKIPISSLPPGPDGFSWGLNLVYNSNILFLSQSYQCVTPLSSPNPTSCLLLAPDPYGGWQYSIGYQLYEEQLLRSLTYNCSTDPTPHNYRLILVFPDGSRHTLHRYPNGDVGDGFDTIDPASGEDLCGMVISTPITYHI